MADISPEAESLFAAYLARREAGEDIAFEAWVREHPEQEADLRALQSRDQALAAGLPGAHSPPSGQALSFFRPGRSAAPTGAPTSPQGSALHPGDRLGDFRLVEVIGTGGMGQVWETEEVPLGRRVALKVVLPNRVDSRSLELFVREARAGGRLSHPGIVRVNGFGETDGVHWINEELVEGSWTLRDFIDEMRNAESLPPDYYRRVAEFAIQLADALQAAHDSGVIHRDVKPQNVLITPEDQPKLTDFGLARITDETALSVTGEFAGTYLYMSPEQVTARRMGIDHRTDVFSLGVVLYEMLALQRPFEGDTTHQIAEKIVTWDPPDLHRLRSRIPVELAVICSKALEKRRDDRYATMAELAADLRRHLSNQPIAARPPGPLRRAHKWSQRHPTKSVAAVVTAVAAIVVAILGVRVTRANQSLQARTVQLDASNSALERKTEQASQSAFAAGIQAAALALEHGDFRAGRVHLDRAQRFGEGWEWGYLNARLSPHAYRLEIEPGRVAMSPDGAVLAVEAGAEIALRDAITGETLRTLEETPNTYITELAWEPVSESLVASHGELEGVSRWDPQTGELIEATTNRGTGIGSLYTLAFSPDGRYGAWAYWHGVRVQAVADAELPEEGLGIDLPGSRFDESLPFPTALHFTADSRYLFAGFSHGALFRQDLTTGETLSLAVGDSEISSIDTAPGMDEVLVSSLDQHVRLVDPASEMITTILVHGTERERKRSSRYKEGYKRFVTLEQRPMARFGPDAARVFAVGLDGYLRIYDLRSELTVVEIPCHNGPGFDVSFAQGDSLVITSGIDGVMAFRREELLRAGRGQELELHPHVLAGGPTESTFTLGSCGGFGSYSIEQGELLSQRPGRSDLLYDCEYARGTDAVWAAYRFYGEYDDELDDELDGLVSVFGPDGERIDIHGIPEDACDLAVAPDGSWIAAAGRLGDLAVFDPRTREVVQRLRLPGEKRLRDEVTRTPLAPSAAGELLFAACGSSLSLIDTTTWQVLATRAIDTPADLSRLAVSPAGDALVLGLRGRPEIVALDTATLESVLLRTPHMGAGRGEVTAIAFTPDGTRFVTGGEDGLVQLWDAGSREPILTLGRHASPVVGLAFASDTGTLVSLADDSEILIHRSQL